MGSAADVGVQVAPRRETPLGRVSHAGPQPESAVLIDDPSFRALLRKQWKSVLQNPAYRQKLGTHCVFCGQWAEASGVKQHIRLAHDYTHSLHKEAVDRCTPLGLAAESPCKYCNAVHKQPRRHLLSCSAVYQASLAHLYVQRSEDPADQAQHDRGGPTIDCSSGGDGGFRSCDGAAFPGNGDLTGDPGTKGGCLGRMVQQGQTVPAEGRRWRQRNLVRLVEAQGAGGKLFGNRHSGSSNAKLDPVDDEACAEARERTRSPEARNGLHAVHRHGALLVPGAAQAGGHEVGGHEVAGPLCGKQGHLAARPSADAGNGSGASEQTRSTPARRCPPATLQKLWLDQRRPECLHANVALLRVESHREERVSGEDPSASPHPGSGDLGRDKTLPSSWRFF